MKLKLVTPERVVFEDEVDAVTAMTESGEVTILPHHVPLVSVLRPGEMRVKKGSGEYFLAVTTGFLEMRPGNELVILADTAERAEELDEAKIEQAKQRAQKLLEQVRHQDDVSFAAAAAMLEREVLRLKVVRKHRSHAGRFSEDSSLRSE